MRDFHTLPLPDGTSLSLPLTLPLIETMEEAGGSLFRAADLLLQKELRLTEIIHLLAAAYRAGHSGVNDTALQDFLIRANPALLLGDLLLAILQPLREIGAETAGERLRTGV